MKRRALSWYALAAMVGLASSAVVQSKVVFNEIMYHPVEREAFDANGSPALDLSEDVHEFIELFNAGPTTGRDGLLRRAGDQRRDDRVRRFHRRMLNENDRKHQNPTLRPRNNNCQRRLKQ